MKRKYASEEIVVSSRDPDINQSPDDAPAGSVASVQRRRWKVWITVADHDTHCTCSKIWVREARFNRWTLAYDREASVNTLYTSDGFLVADRTVNMAGKRLTFTTHGQKVLIDGGAATDITALDVIGDLTLTGVGSMLGLRFEGEPADGFFVEAPDSVSVVTPEMQRAFEVRKSDRSTAVLSVDSSAARVGVNTNAPVAALDVQGNTAGKITKTAASLTVENGYGTVFVENGASDVTITLPNAGGVPGLEIHVARSIGSTGVVIVTGLGQIETLYGTLSASVPLSGLGSVGAKVTFISDGTNWLRKING